MHERHLGTVSAAFYRNFCFHRNFKLTELLYRTRPVIIPQKRFWRLLLRAPDLQLVRDDRDVIDTPWRNWVNLHFFHFLRKETNLGCLIISCCLTQRIWAKNLSLLSVSFSLSRHVLCGVRCIYEWSLLLVIFLTTHYVYTSTSHLTNIERSVFKEIFSSSSSS